MEAAPTAGAAKCKSHYKPEISTDMKHTRNEEPELVLIGTFEDLALMVEDSFEDDYDIIEIDY